MPRLLPQVTGTGRLLTPPRARGEDNVTSEFPLNTHDRVFVLGLQGA